MKINLYYLLILCACLGFVSCNESVSTILNPNDILSTINCDSIPVGTENTHLRIVAIMANPSGIDDFRESIVLKNYSKNMRINISNYYIKNSRGMRFELTSGFTNSCEQKIETISTLEFLNNSNDSLFLCYGSDIIHQRIGIANTKEGEYQLVK